MIEFGCEICSVRLGNWVDEGDGCWVWLYLDARMMIEGGTCGV